MKKHYWIFALLLCISLEIKAQDYLNNGLLFPQFKEGIVIYKNFSRVNALLNYNTLEEEILFVDTENTIMALADPSTVIAVIIDDRRFVFAQQDAFFEEIAIGNDRYFYIQYKSKLISQGKGVGYGSHSATASVTSISSVQGKGGDYRQLKTDEIFETKVERNFYLKINNKYKNIKNIKMLGKLFKGREAEIEDFAKKENIDFGKAVDIAKILTYCYGL